MSIQGHTPAPWTVRRLSIGAQRPPGFITQIGILQTPGAHFVYASAEGEDAANARLIAIAPELLELAGFVLHQKADGISDTKIAANYNGYSLEATARRLIALAKKAEVPA